MRRVAESGRTSRTPSTRRFASGAAAVTAAILALLVVSVDAGVAQAQPPAGPKGSARYKATRRIVVDSQSRQVRMPSAQEVQQLVDNLATLTKRSTDDLPQGEVPGGGTAVDLQGGFGGVMLARPNDDGTLETRCVFTLEEGAAFLGLVRDDS